jgi:hypothetical protein
MKYYPVELAARMRARAVERMSACFDASQGGE